MSRDHTVWDNDGVSAVVSVGNTFVVLPHVIAVSPIEEHPLGHFFWSITFEGGQYQIILKDLSLSVANKERNGFVEALRRWHE